MKNVKCMYYTVIFESALSGTKALDALVCPNENFTTENATN